MPILACNIYLHLFTSYLFLYWDFYSFPHIDFIPFIIKFTPKYLFLGEANLNGIVYLNQSLLLYYSSIGKRLTFIYQPYILKPFYLKTLSLDIAPTLGNVSRKIIPRAEKGVRSLSLSGFSLLVNWHSCPLNDLPWH